ncbi:unnamed protein product, partial [Prorocentrum cordatum]
CLTGAVAVRSAPGPTAQERGLRSARGPFRKARALLPPEAGARVASHGSRCFGGGKVLAVDLEISEMDLVALTPLGEGGADGLAPFGSARGRACWPRPEGVFGLRDGFVAVEGGEAAPGAEEAAPRQSVDKFEGGGPKGDVDAEDRPPLQARAPPLLEAPPAPARSSLGRPFAAARRFASAARLQTAADLLGVPLDAPRAVIEAAFRRASASCRPDEAPARPARRWRSPRAPSLARVAKAKAMGEGACRMPPVGHAAAPSALDGAAPARALAAEAELRLHQALPDAQAAANGQGPANSALASASPAELAQAAARGRVELSAAIRAARAPVAGSLTPFPLRGDDARAASRAARAASVADRACNRRLTEAAGREARGLKRAAPVQLGRERRELLRAVVHNAEVVNRAGLRGRAERAGLGAPASASGRTPAAVEAEGPRERAKLGPDDPAASFARRDQRRARARQGRGRARSRRPRPFIALADVLAGPAPALIRQPPRPPAPFTTLADVRAEPAPAPLRRPPQAPAPFIALADVRSVPAAPPASALARALPRGGARDAQAIPKGAAVAALTFASSNDVFKSPIAALARGSQLVAPGGRRSRGRFRRAPVAQFSVARPGHGARAKEAAAAALTSASSNDVFKSPVAALARGNQLAAPGGRRSRWRLRRAEAALDCPVAGDTGPRGPEAAVPEAMSQ